jgi:hypothetical protein
MPAVAFEDIPIRAESIPELGVETGLFGALLFSRGPRALPGSSARRGALARARRRAVIAIQTDAYGIPWLHTAPGGSPPQDSQ